MVKKGKELSDLPSPEKIKGVDQLHFLQKSVDSKLPPDYIIPVIGPPSSGKETVIKRWFDENPGRVRLVDEQTDINIIGSSLSADPHLYPHEMQILAGLAIDEARWGQLPKAVKDNPTTIQALTEALQWADKSEKSEHLPIIAKRWWSPDRDIFDKALGRDEEIDIKFKAIELILGADDPEVGAVITCFISPDESKRRRELNISLPETPGPTFNHLDGIYSGYLELHKSILNGTFPQGYLTEKKPLIYYPLNMEVTPEKAYQKFDGAMKQILKKLS